MIVEGENRDYFSTISSVQPTNAANSTIAVVTAPYPMILRVRQINWACKCSVTPAHSILGFALVVVRGGETVHGLAAVPVPVAGDDWYEPASRVVFQNMLLLLDSNLGTGPGAASGMWAGDGRIIRLATGDSLWWTSSNDTANSPVMCLSTLIEVIK